MSLREKKTSTTLPLSPSVVMEHHLKQMAHNVLHPYSPLCMVLPFANLKLLYHPSKVKQQTHQTCKRVNTFCFWTYIGSNIIHLQKLKTKCHKSYQDSDKSIVVPSWEACWFYRLQIMNASFSTYLTTSEFNNKNNLFKALLWNFAENLL